MQGRFYQDVFEPSGLALVVPDETEQAYIHDKYMTELVKGVLRAGDARAAARDRRADEGAMTASTP